MMPFQDSSRFFFFFTKSFAEDNFQTWKASLLEVVLLFYRASIQLLTEFNKFLQRSEPTIIFLQRTMLSLKRKIPNRIIKTPSL